MSRLSSCGFTLVELAITILVLGLLLGFSVPAFNSITSTYKLKGASENLATQLRLAREKAIATASEQPMHIPNTTTYHIHYLSPAVIGTTWVLPNGITIVSGVGTWFRMEKDGRCQDSGLIVLEDRRGLRDTVSVQLSGLVLTY
jgi:prepilin-type N-terminal cleavage/methylation domain-containing protein